MAWTTPKGYELCPDCHCDRPVRNGETAAHETIWQCKPSDGCTAAGCGCYVCVIAPGENRLRIESKPGEAGSSRRLPPGWAFVCACLKELAGEKDSGWGEREDVGWIAPKGYAFDKPCPGHCQLPRWDSAKGGSWVCGVRPSEDPASERNCYLVGVAPGEKQLHFLARPGSAYSHVDVPPGWGIFCICLKSA